MLQVCTQLLFSQLLTEREVAALHKPGAPPPMVLLIPHHVGGACGGEGEGKVMDFWHRTGPPGPNRQRARVEDMPWGNYNSIILQYMYIVHSFSGRYALGREQSGICASGISTLGEKAHRANREGLEKGSNRLSGLQIRH